MSKPQHQGSLEDQLDELTSRAAQDGLYDAQDWLVRRRASASGRNNEKLTEAQVHALCARGIINQTTCNNALRSFHGDNGHVGEHAIRICEVAIEALIERARDRCGVCSDPGQARHQVGRSSRDDPFGRDAGARADALRTRRIGGDWRDTLMGYCMDQGETKFRIKAENKAKAHQAVRGLLAKTSKMSGFASSGSSVTRHFSWVDMDELRTTKTIEGQLKAWRWEADTDEKTGDVVNLHFRGEKLGDDTVLFGALAPFVEDGSFIQMSGEDGAVWRWCFADGKLSEKSPSSW